MRIILCTHDGKDYFGGPYEWAKRIGVEWRRRGYEVVYLILSDHDSSVSSVYQFLISHGFICKIKKNHSITQWRDHTNARVDWFVKKALKVKPDVFIANAVLEALYASQFLEKVGIKTFGVCHTDDPGHQWFFDLFVIQRRFGPSNVVFVSKHLSEKGGKAMACHVISCGTPVGHSTASFLTTPFRFVYVGKIAHEAKRILDCAKAFRAALIELSHFDLEFHIYGDGPQRDELISLLNEWQTRIFYHGRADSQEILAIMIGFQGFVLLSDYEGQPVALMEAMSVGLVPICLHVKSGIPELIDHGENGYLVNDRQGSFVEAVRKVVSNREAWEEMSHKAREKIVNGYSMEAVGNLWDEAFEKAVVSTNKEMALPSVHPQLVQQDIRIPSFKDYLSRQMTRIIRRLGKLKTVLP